MIQHLTKLTPAETLAILESGRPDVLNLLKFTLGDLFLRRVLAVEKAPARLDSGETILAAYARRGLKFDQHQPRKHEMVFLVPFQRDPDLRVLLMHLAGIAFASVGQRHVYRNVVMESIGVADYFESRWLGRMRLSPAGKTVRSAIVSELSHLQASLEALLASDAARAQQLLDSVGGNVLFLKNARPSIMTEIEAALDMEQEEQDAGYPDMGDPLR